MGVVHVSWTPLRRVPRHASEMVSQVLLGEVLESVDSTDIPNSRPEWAAVRAPDGYEGFVTRGSLLECPESAAADWSSRTDTTSLGTGLSQIDGGDSARHAPWGAKLVSVGDGTLELPDGSHVHPTDLSRIVTDAERAFRYPHDTATPIQTARDWLGTPYLWGGRTEQGVDCSGFVQAVFGLHGFALPRDSGDQIKAGSGVEGVAGDLCFFAFDDGPVSHVGICMGDKRMIHSSETRGCVAIDQLGEGDYGRRLADGFVGAVRVEG